MVMIPDSIKHYLSIFAFALFVVIPSLILAVFIVLRDLAFQFCGFVYNLFFNREVIPLASESKQEINNMTSRVRDISKPLLQTSISQSREVYEVDPLTRADHLFGIPRRVILSTVGAFSFIVTSVLNRTRVYNIERLVKLVHSRPHNTALITVSNHMSTLDDPLLWGIRGLRATDPKICRWTLTAKDICFTNSFISYFFRVGKCIPIVRGGGIYQECIFEAIDKVDQGEWLHTFPEGRVIQEYGSLNRLKWGVASIIARSSPSNPPIILCVGHSGFEKVMPEKHWFGRRAMLPVWFNKISVVVSEPMHFDINELRKEAQQAVLNNESHFGSDAIVVDEESREDMGGSVCVNGEENDVELGEGRGDTGEDELRLKKEEKREKLKMIDVVEQRLYAEISKRIKDDLERVVMKAHELNKQC